MSLGHYVTMSKFSPLPILSPPTPPPSLPSVLPPLYESQFPHWENENENRSYFTIVDWLPDTRQVFNKWE